MEKQLKKTGSFYTPTSLVKYMTDYALKSDISNILEPSVGDGRFVNQIILDNSDINIDAVEIDNQKASKLKVNYKKQKNISIINNDFIEYSLSSTNKYDLVIGNPPYISKKNLDSTVKKNIECLISTSKLSKTIMENLWVAFLLASIRLLTDQGAIFFVLPFEFLQVKYAEKLRNFLETKFNSIEITTYQEPVFPNIEQRVCLVYLSNKDCKPYIKYATFDNIEKNNILTQTNIVRNKPLAKWSNSILDDHEIELLMKLKNKFTLINNVGDISPGIVTGANNYFIIDKTSCIDMDASKFTLPIIRKSNIIKRTLTLTSQHFTSLSKQEENLYLLNLTDPKVENYPSKLQAYIQKGKDEALHKRFKCSKRDPWYRVPIIKNGDVFFFKRFHKLPKIIVNEMDAYSTDICYNIRLKENFDKFSIVFCFFNSLTLALCEYYGRFYGGGVCELTPSEFKSVSIPYRKINRNQFKKLDLMFSNGESIENIIDYVDRVVLSQYLEKDILLMLANIRNKYLRRRLNRYH